MRTFTLLILLGILNGYFMPPVIGIAGAVVTAILVGGFIGYFTSPRKR